MLTYFCHNLAIGHLSHAFNANNRSIGQAMLKMLLKFTFRRARANYPERIGIPDQRENPLVIGTQKTLKRTILFAFSGNITNPIKRTRRRTT